MAISRIPKWLDDYTECGVEDPVEHPPKRGTMLWFNEVKDVGVLLTEEGERLPVSGSGFAGGLRPKGRCARAVVSYEVREIAGASEANEVAMVADEDCRRARRRRMSAVR